MERYAIPEENMERLKKKLATIKKKCSQYGCAFVFNEVGEEFREVLTEDGMKQTIRFILVEAEGCAVVNGWQFVAALEYTDKGNIIKGIADVEVPDRYYNAAPCCEHCRVARFRKDTYIVRNIESGEFKQVGKSCLKDFTNGMSAAEAARIMSYFAAIEEEMHCNFGAGSASYYETKEVLLYAAEAIAKFGYMKRNEEGIRTTASRVRDYMLVDRGRAGIWQKGCDAEMERVHFDAHTDENVERTADALAWIAEQEESSNYIHNLKTVCQLEYIKISDFGLAVSLFAAFSRAQKAMRENESSKGAETASEYVGEVGQRVKIEVQSFTCAATWESYYGTTFLYKMLDAAGNVYIWKTGKHIDGAQNVAGTVKGHTVYNGVKQTELTRCKVG